MCNEDFDRAPRGEEYPDGYWDYMRRCEDEMSLEERMKRDREQEEHNREKHRVW